MVGGGWVRPMVVGSDCGWLEVVACDGVDCWWLVVFGGHCLWLMVLLLVERGTLCL